MERDLVVEGNFIDWVGEKDELDTIGIYHQFSEIKLLRELNILEMNEKNEDEAYKAWGM